LAALAAFAPAPVNLVAALAGCMALIAGVIGAWDHTRLFFVPALAALVVGGAKLWTSGRDFLETDMTHYLSRDRLAIGAAVAVPLAAAAVLLPFRTSLSNTNIALLLVVVVVAVAAIGNAVAGGIAAVSAAAWFDFFLPCPITGSRSADRRT
jgi:Domain of unknown function (DUF4118)